MHDKEKKRDVAFNVANKKDAVGASIWAALRQESCSHFSLPQRQLNAEETHPAHQELGKVSYENSVLGMHQFCHLVLSQKTGNSQTLSSAAFQAPEPRICNEMRNGHKPLRQLPGIWRHNQKERQAE